MISRRSVPFLAALGIIVMLGIGVWLLSGTPGTLVDDKPDRFGLAPQSDRPMVVISVEEGDSASDIGEKLEEAAVIQSARLFTVLAALMGAGSNLEAGNYEFGLGETALIAVQRISQGRTSAFGVTIREGLRLEEIAELLEAENIVPAQEFLAALSEPYQLSFLAALPEGATLEGFLFPATYEFPFEVSAVEVVGRMLAAFDQRYQESISTALASSGLTLLEAVTLASIVEREAVLPEERATIAAVFLNRLELGIALQADPTVQYAIANDPASVEAYGYWKPELTEADLALQSPYNTYVLPGLPPAPIANPGLDSILAAVQPAKTDYLYFVACQDGSGRQIFAETLDQHIDNIARADRGECPAS
ncbi:MAG: endolytic transglycosylase MltG [Chloroflexi bacterium]|nr:endolytic transglycosylase MltG [Chloroflexota bacterium]